GKPGRHEQAEAHRLLEFGQHRAGTLAQGVEMLLGEIDTSVAKDLGAYDVEAYEDDCAEQRGDQRDAAGRSWLRGFRLVLIGHDATSRSLFHVDETYIEPEAEYDQRHEEHDRWQLQDAIRDVLEMCEERHRTHRVDDEARRPRAHRCDDEV